MISLFNSRLHSSRHCFDNHFAKNIFAGCAYNILELCKTSKLLLDYVNEHQIPNSLRLVSGPGSRDLIWGPSSPGSQDRRHRVYRSIQSRQPGLDLGPSSPGTRISIIFPVSRSPVILFHQPYSSQSIVTCMLQ